MNKLNFRLSAFLFCFFSLSISLSARDITSLIRTENKFIGGTEDGYIVIWDVNQSLPAERFQLTMYKIEKIVSHPLKEEICIIETGGIGSYRISAWNYALKKRLFSLYSAEPVTYINYSGSGNFIIAAGLGESNLTLIDSQTGKIIDTRDTDGINRNPIAFAATGRAERNMLIYQRESGDSFSYEKQPDLSGGRILYYDLESGSVAGEFQAPGNLSNPVILRNNNFLAGINSQGLLIIDAASGEITDRIENIETDSLLCSSNEGLYCLGGKDTETTISRFSIGDNGKIIRRERLPISFNTRQANSGQIRITEIAAGKRTIAFLTENGDLCFLPLDYRNLSSGGRPESLIHSRKERYTRITYVSEADKERDQYILWQTLNTRNAPQLITAGLQSDGEILNQLTGRFPVRSIAYFNEKILVLDASGNLSVRNMADTQARPDFTFTSAGATDAAFINDENIILSRNVSNMSPFLSVNIRTGETLPVNYGAQTALSVYSGKSGKIYAEAVELESDRFKTTVIDLFPAPDRTRSSSQLKIFEYLPEANHLSIAESAGHLAISCDGEGAFILSGEIINFERTNALPVKLLGCDDFFLALDSEGSIAWHDNTTGKLLALFSLYSDKWALHLQH
jgi:WD40 repeat protein